MTETCVINNRKLCARETITKLTIYFLVRCINFTAYWMCKYIFFCLFLCLLLFVVVVVVVRTTVLFHRRYSDEFLHAPASQKGNVSLLLCRCAVLAGRAGSAQGRPWLLLLALSFRDVYPSLAQ